MHEKEGDRIETISKFTRSTVEYIEEENYCFDVSSFLDAIRIWLTNEDIIQPKNHLNAAISYLSDCTRWISVLRAKERVPWGINVPDDSTQTESFLLIHVWLDALVSYIAAVSHPYSIDLHWPPTCQFIGKDILRFHVTLWPSILMALGLKLSLKLFVHGHWLVNRTKMSKSLGNVIDPFVAAKNLFSDGLQYYLLPSGALTDDKNFDLEVAKQVVFNDLSDNLGNLLNRATVKQMNPMQMYPTFNQKEFETRFKNGSLFVEKLDRLYARCNDYVTELNFYKVLTAIADIGDDANKLFHFHQPWCMNAFEEREPLLYVIYESLRISNVLVQPFVPEYADRSLSRRLLRNNFVARSQGGLLEVVCSICLIISIDPIKFLDSPLHAFTRRWQSPSCSEKLLNAMDSCSPALRGFLSVRLFMNLRISNRIGSSERVSVDSIIDFLQVKKNKILKMVHLKSCDSSGKGYLSLDDLSCSIKELVLQQATHLHDLVLDDPIMLSCYECIATRKFFFFLDTIGHKKIRIIDIIATGWLEEIVDAGWTEHLDNYDATNILELSDRSRSAVVSNWFSRANFLYIQCLYSRLDSDGNGLLSLSEMENFRFISNAFIRTVFETRQTYNDNEIDLVAFCDFILALGHPSEPASIRYYFRTLDVDGDGFLNATDLQYFYDHIAKMLFECHNEEDGILPPAFEDVKDEIFDMCRPSDPAKIALNELIASGNGETIVSMLTDSEAFISYEFREDSTY